MRKLSLSEFEQKVKLAHPKENLKAITYTKYSEDAVCQCNNCKTLYTKKASNFLDKRKTSICKICFPTQQGVLKENYRPPIDYKLQEPYNGAHNKILVKHKCGFVWKVKPHNLDMGKGCPKCSKKISKGERKIIQYLESNNIEYIFQHPLKIDGHNLLLDFYLPELDLYIEYNGEQHYYPIKYFGGEEKFLLQIKNDKLKKDFLGNKLLIISYLDFNNIENILKSSTTIPKGSRGKHPEAETI